MLCYTILYYTTVSFQNFTTVAINTINRIASITINRIASITINRIASIIIIIIIIIVIYGQFSKFHVCFCGLDPGNLKFETVRTNRQHICF